MVVTNNKGKVKMREQDAEVEPWAKLFGYVFKAFGLIWVVSVVVGLLLTVATVLGVGWLGYSAIQWFQADTARIEAER